MAKSTGASSKKPALKKRRSRPDGSIENLSRRIGANLRLLRGNRTLQDVCDRCTTDSWTCYPANIDQIERGVHMPSVAVLYRIAMGLGVTLNDLVAEPIAIPPMAGGPRQWKRRAKVAV